MRIRERKARGKKMACTTVSCNCCKNRVEIEHDEFSLEINGVPGTISEWRAILLPLLGLQKRLSKTTRPSLPCIDGISTCKPDGTDRCAGCGG